MQLLPAYYTTTNNRKRKAKRKTKSQLEAERIHEKFLAKYCGKSGGVNDTVPTKYQRPSEVLTEGSIPSLSNDFRFMISPRCATA